MERKKEQRDWDAAKKGYRVKGEVVTEWGRDEAVMDNRQRTVRKGGRDEENEGEKEQRGMKEKEIERRQRSR